MDQGAQHSPGGLWFTGLEQVDRFVQHGFGEFGFPLKPFHDGYLEVSRECHFVTYSWTPASPGPFAPCTPYGTPRPGVYPSPDAVTSRPSTGESAIPRLGPDRSESRDLNRSGTRQYRQTI